MANKLTMPTKMTLYLRPVFSVGSSARSLEAVELWYLKRDEVPAFPNLRMCSGPLHMFCTTIGQLVMLRAHLCQSPNV